MNDKTTLVPLGDLDRMASVFADSNMFGARTKEQAMSLLLLAQAEGVHPAIAMRDFDIIQGKPAKKAEAMHRAFLAAGGTIKWNRLDDDMADATFSHPQGGTARITWDMERVKKAGLSGKDMYGKYRRQMLRSRVISEGCRTVYPAATSGLYVPEEVREFRGEPQPQPEKDMGAAQIVKDVDETQRIPGVGKDATPEPNRAVSLDQAMELAALLAACDDKAEADFLKIAKITRLDALWAVDYDEALEWVKRRKAKAA